MIVQIKKVKINNPIDNIPNFEGENAIIQVEQGIRSISKYIEQLRLLEGKNTPIESINPSLQRNNTYSTKVYDLIENLVLIYHTPKSQEYTQIIIGERTQKKTAIGSIPILNWLFLLAEVKHELIQQKHYYQDSGLEDRAQKSHEPRLYSHEDLRLYP